MKRFEFAAGERRGEQKAGEQAFGEGKVKIQKSFHPALETDEQVKERLAEAKVRAKGSLEDFRTQEKSTLIESDASATRRARQSMEQDNIGDLRISQKDLAEAGVETDKQATVRTKRSFVSLPSARESFQVKEGELVSSGIQAKEDPWQEQVRKRAEGIVINKEPAPFRSGKPDTLVESRSEAERRIEQSEFQRAKKEAAAALALLRNEIANVESHYAQLSTDILNLREKISTEPDEAKQTAQKKVLVDFERERLAVKDELDILVRGLAKKEGNYREVYGT